MALGGFQTDTVIEGLRWLKPWENLKLLGIFFNAKKEASLIEENWSLKIEEINKLIKSWSARKASLWGKSLVSKAFLLSKLGHSLQALALPENVMDIIDRQIFQYLWLKTDLGKRQVERIKRDTLCLQVEDGGIGMISVKDQSCLMLIKWLHKGCRSELSTHHALINSYLGKLGGPQYILNCTAPYSSFKGISNIDSVFWQKATTAWTKLDKTGYQADPNNIPIFNNNMFLFKGHPLLIKKWIKHGLKFYHQMIKNNNAIKSFDEIRQLIPPYGGLMLHYIAVRSALMAYQKKTHTHNLPDDNHLAGIFSLSNKALRNILVKQRQTEPIKCISFWQRKLNINIQPYFFYALKCTKEMGLRALQYKIFHNIYPNNVLLKKMNIKDASRCDFCHELDFVDHMFIDCSRLKPLWDEVSIHIESISDEVLPITKTAGLFGFLPDSVSCSKNKLTQINHLILIAKFSIAKSIHSGNPNLLDIFERELFLRKKSFPSLTHLHH